MSGDIPQWAIKRAYELAGERGHVSGLQCGAVDAFAMYLASHEEPPVDPLREEAIGLVLAEAITRTDNQIAAIKSGQAGEGKIELAMAALRRGMELAREQGS